MNGDMWKPPFRVKPYANAKYKFLVRGKIDGKWKRSYFVTEAEAIAFAEQQNAAAQAQTGPDFKKNGAPAPTPLVSPERHPRLQPPRTLDFTELVTPVYLGPRIERYLGDSWCMHLPFAYDLMRELAPKVFVELGVKQGESYFAFCQSAAENKISVRCYGIDSWRGDIQTGNLDPEIEHEVAEYNWRYSSFSELKVMLFAEALGEFADGSIDLLHIDGTHTYNDVKTDFESWLPKLSPHGVILFHDVVVRDGGFGVWKVWEEIVGERNSFLFEFGHGLGVWKKEPVTESSPALLRKLMGAGEAERRDMNRFYADAAAALALWHDLLGQPATGADMPRLRQAGESKEGQIANLKREVQAKADRIAQLQSAIETKSAEVAALPQQIEKGLEHVAQLNHEITTLQRENDQQARLIDTLKAQLEQKDDRLARASKDLLDAEWEALTLRGTALRKADSVDPAISQTLELQNRAELAESDRDHLREMVVGLQRDLEQAELSSQRDLEQLRQASLEELRSAQDQLTKSTKELRLYQKQLDRLRRDTAGKLILPFGRSQRKLQQLMAVPRAHD
ncbi:MAG TPA: class I SAM-dependent methyltransferase [Chthoniobacterales bacterium]|nr:class I SAM-dependent methyltransferase [Chthoniobacterales bacterium]